MGSLHTNIRNVPYYERGGDSGPGFYGESAEYKARLINEAIQEHGIRSIIDSFAAMETSSLVSI